MAGVELVERKSVTRTPREEDEDKDEDAEEDEDATGDVRDPWREASGAAVDPPRPPDRDGITEEEEEG